MLGRVAGFWKMTVNAQWLVSIKEVLVGPLEEWVIHCAGFWGLGESAESPSGKAGMCGGSRPDCAGRLWFMAGWDAFAWESTVGCLGPQNEELQPQETSNPVVQPGLYSWSWHGCAQEVLQER